MITYKLSFSTENQNIFWVSDLHYNHDRDFIWGAPGRNYKNVREMNEHIIQSWNETITEDDIVFHLGDIIFNDFDGTRLLDLFSKLRFKQLYCVFGNHTSGERHVYKELMREIGFPDKEMFPLDLSVTDTKKVTYIGYHADIEINGQYIVLNHYPITSWNKIRRKSWMIHGHTHCNLKHTSGLKTIDIGWDYQRKPVSFQELQSYMSKKTSVSAGDHHK